jgi:hypothetical protein
VLEATISSDAARGIAVWFAEILLGRIRQLGCESFLFLRVAVKLRLRVVRFGNLISTDA